MEAPLIPGNTYTYGDPAQIVKEHITRLSEIPSLKDRKVILLSTATITKENLYANGLLECLCVLSDV